MNFINTIVRIFWNKEEARLRTLWRLGLHSLILFSLTAVFTVALLFLVVIIGSFSGTNLQHVIAGTDPIQIIENPWIGSAIIPAATFLGILLTTYLAGRWIDRRKFREFGFAFSKVWWLEFAFGLALGALLMGVIFLFGWLTGNIRVTGFFEPFSQNSTFISGILRAIIFFLFVGVYEEVLSRGYHLINLAEGLNLPIIGKRWALIIAWVVSSIVFGLLHFGNPNATWISTLNISLAGVFLGLGMVLTGRLAIPIGCISPGTCFKVMYLGFRSVE